MNISKTAIQPIRRAIALLLLFVYLGGMTPAGLAMAAGLGGLDSDHQVLFQPGENGAMKIVLHHGSDCSGHHHGAVARLLTAFSRPANSSNPDHVLQFNSSTARVEDAQHLASAPNKLVTMPAFWLEPATCFSFKPLDFTQIFYPPTSQCETLLPVRFTVLLI